MDRLYENKAIAEEKDRLILQMGSPDNSFAIEAVRQLRVKGWLFDGTLSSAKANLSFANLHSADLANADLRNTIFFRADLTDSSLLNTNFENANLSGANLSSARLITVNFAKARLNNVNFEGARILNVEFSGAQIKFANFRNITGPLNYDSRLSPDPFQVADSLRGTTLPGGKKYSGEYNLQGDINDGISQNIDVTDKEAMDKFYHESIEEIEIVISTEERKGWIDERRSSGR